ncbi:glutathione hydrolase-like YwrD proenzyme isoform X2 [Clupea harengus]|uniref:Glutathione hydrolase-like YwrD proenzyme isoform X2 n=1 Tax=Clupea harengus TaxID=7950 RepID=A0A6P8FXH2_CLUHA|nr:glutathione hydrolase-like YwrD proenzyme isoform X2 [Clupea harengus]
MVFVFLCNSGILKKGGNAADAAVAVAAALNVTEPCSTGIGGDSFCLYFDARTGHVRGLNGSGRSPKAQTLELMQSRGYTKGSPTPPFHALNITVPGAAACWCDTIQLFGSKKLSLADILEPACDLASGGFPVAEVTAYAWAKWTKAMREVGRELGGDFLPNNQPPKHGQVVTNPGLAQTFQEISHQGKDGFYAGRIAEAIVEVIRENGGVMSLEDLRSHTSTEITPIFTDYKTVRLWEVPPNGQGMAALIALNILENFPIKGMNHNSADYLHLLVEAFKLSLADTTHFNADPAHVNVPLEGLLAKDYSQQRAQLIQMDRARASKEPGIPRGSETVYFSVVDGEGNACSFVNSNYMGFGTGLVPKCCGFSLHNRGAHFSMDANHANCIGPEKRPYQTIIPALLTEASSNRLLCSFGVMGAFMQPQGHVQVLLNMLEFGMNPQQALDAPRVFVQYDAASQQWQLSLETGVEERVAEELRRRGHAVHWPVAGHDRAQFGRGQVISIGAWWDPASPPSDPTHRVLWAGSDPRADGCAVGY